MAKEEKIPKITEKSPGLPWSETIMYGHKLSTVKGRAKLQPSKSVMSAGGGECPGPQVWSLTQLYSVDFSRSRIGVKKCVFNKHTIKVCASC